MLQVIAKMPVTGNDVDQLSWKKNWEAMSAVLSEEYHQVAGM